MYAIFLEHHVGSEIISKKLYGILDSKKEAEDHIKTRAFYRDLDLSNKGHLTPAIEKFSIPKITEENYHDDTKGDFAPVPNGKEILEAFLVWNRKKKKPDYFEIDGTKYFPDFRSQKRNAYWHSRSISFYFRTDDGFIIRISDHWSESQTAYSKSGKLNCGSIRSCYWTNLKGERFELRVPSEKYASVFIAGKIKPEKLKSNLKRKYEVRSN